MSKIDRKIIEILKSSKEGNIRLFKRFLDDIISIWCGTTKELDLIFDALNQIHENIKFTMSHTNPINEKIEDKCKCDTKLSIPFLDTAISIETDN